MDKVQVGEFEVRALTVGEGIDLLSLVGDDAQQGKFQRELLLRTTTRNGQAIVDEPFANLMPHLNGIVSAAMRLNGFATT